MMIGGRKKIILYQCLFIAIHGATSTSLVLGTNVEKSEFPALIFQIVSMKRSNADAVDVPVKESILGQNL